MDRVAQAIYECETCTEVRQAKHLNSLWYGGWWLKYKYGQAWQTDYLTLSHTHQGKSHVCTMVEISPGWLEIYSVSRATAQNTTLK